MKINWKNYEKMGNLTKIALKKDCQNINEYEDRKASTAVIEPDMEQKKNALYLWMIEKSGILMLENEKMNEIGEEFYIVSARIAAA